MTETKPAEQSLLKREPVAVEYVPYGAQDKLKLTVAMVQNLIAVKTKSGKTCSDRDAIRFIAMCQAKRMNPFEGDCFLIGYDGKDGPSFALVTAHQTYLKRAELHPEFDGMKSGVIVRQDGKLLDLEGDFHDEGQQVVGGWATVFFKTRKQPMHKRLRLSRFQKPFGVWQEDPGGMVCKCAEADALRSAFPTMLGGLYLREEVEIDANKKDFSKPLFNGTQPAMIVDAKFTEAADKPAEETAKAEVQPEPKPEPVTEAQPEPAPEKPKEGKRSETFNPLKAVRSLGKMSKVTDAQILAALAAQGTIDGSQATLEEVALAPLGLHVLTALAEDWAEFVAGIKSRKEKE